MASHSTQGITALVYKPGLDLAGPTYDVRASALGRLANFEYSHRITAVGGFDSAQIEMRENVTGVESWVQDGIGRHVEVYDDAVDLVWEGFVNQVAVNISGLSTVVGPLTDVGNKVRLAYQLADPSTSPPSGYRRTMTDWADDTALQELYGVWPKILSTGQVTGAMAAQLATMWLTDNARPLITKQFAAGSAAVPSLSLGCLGYVHRLNYPYTQIANAGEYNLSLKVADVLDYDANFNGLFSSANADIVANTVQVIREEERDRSAWAILKSLVSVGDAAFARYLFGVYEDRKAYYAAAPTEVEYHQQLSDPAQRVTTVAGATVKPWRVRPGKWLLFPDFLIGTETAVNLRDDPRAMFLESVSYSTPFGLQLHGEKAPTASERMSQQFALSGM